MILFGAVAVAAFFGTGVYLLLSFNLQRIAFGYLLLGNGVNLLILTASGFREGAGVPLVRDDGTLGADGLPVHAVDPLPHAFVLTSIVIGFAATALRAERSIAARTRSSSWPASWRGAAPHGDNEAFRTWTTVSRASSVSGSRSVRSAAWAAVPEKSVATTIERKGAARNMGSLSGLHVGGRET